MSRILLFFSVFHVSMASGWKAVGFSKPPPAPFPFPPPLLFFSGEADGIYCWLFSLSERDPEDHVSSRSAWGKSDLGDRVDMGQILFTAGYLSQTMG